MLMFHLKILLSKHVHARVTQVLFILNAFKIGKVHRKVNLVPITFKNITGRNSNALLTNKLFLYKLDHKDKNIIWLKLIDLKVTFLCSRACILKSTLQEQYILSYQMKTSQNLCLEEARMLHYSIMIFQFLVDMRIFRLLMESGC